MHTNPFVQLDHGKIPDKSHTLTHRMIILWLAFYIESMLCHTLWNLPCDSFFVHFQFLIRLPPPCSSHMNVFIHNTYVNKNDSTMHYFSQRATDSHNWISDNILIPYNNRWEKKMYCNINMEGEYEGSRILAASFRFTFFLSRPIILPLWWQESHHVCL